MTPTFTVLIGACAYDRPDRYATLKHTLDSIARQAMVPGDQVIVSIDSFEQPAALVAERAALVRSYGRGFDVTEYNAGYHFFGVEQINFALATFYYGERLATGSHIITMGDDDVFIDGAYATLRPLCAANPEQPILYRFLAPWREVLWDQPRMEMSRISGCCIVAPRQFVGPMNTQTTWPGTDRPFVEHDFFWMQDILSKAPPALWLNEVLVIARPDQRGEDVAHRGVWQCWHCRTVRYYEDMNILTTPHCPQCRAVTDFPGRPVAMVTR